MSIHDVVHDVYPSFQSDDLQTQRDTIFTVVVYTVKTHPRMNTDTRGFPEHTAAIRNTFAILFLMALPLKKKKACGVVPTFVYFCVCVWASWD